MYYTHLLHLFITLIYYTYKYTHLLHSFTTLIYYTHLLHCIQVSLKDMFTTYRSRPMAVAAVMHISQQLGGLNVVRSLVQC